jgi:hypothetical protein
MEKMKQQHIKEEHESRATYLHKAQSSVLYFILVCFHLIHYVSGALK